LLLGDTAQAEEAAREAADVLPDELRDDFVTLVVKTRKDSPLILVGSIIAMVWTASGAVGVLERVLSRLLRRERFDAVVGKLRHLAMAGVLVLLVALMVIAGTEASGIGDELGLGNAAVPIIGAVITVGLTTALFHVAPRGGVAWLHALYGALPAAAVLQLVPVAAGYYLEAVAGRTAVQVFLVLAGLLFTCWLAAVGFLVGAGLAARVENRSVRVAA
jgi:uncharacterized BrkB/YihY/UPF0761 family membrane protein